MDEQRLHRRSASRLGLFTRADATACGFTPYQIRRRVGCGEWQRVRGSVFAFRGSRLTPQVLAAAAHLAAPRSVIAGPSAALWYALPVAHRESRREVWLWTGTNGRGAVAGARLLRDPLADGDVRRVDGVLVTGPGRTVFDCLRLLPEGAALTLLDRALHCGWTCPDELAERVRSRAGWRGTARVAQLLFAAAGSRSEAERAAAVLLGSAGITGWVANARIHDRVGLIGYGDIVFSSARLVIEIDGWAYHGDRARFQRDRTRQNRLVADGWTVLRFTWDDLTRRPADTVAAVRAALRRAS